MFVNFYISSETKNRMGTSVCVVIALLLFHTCRIDVHLPDLPDVATTSEVADAYRDRTVHFQVHYRVQEVGFWSRKVVEAGVSGSGLILANDRQQGVIITNRHVVDPSYTGITTYGNLQISVKVADETEWHQCRVVAVHNQRDVALVFVERPFKRHAAVRVADYEQLRQGEAVVALGNPQGVDYVVTDGILSRIDAAILITQAPISPGSSGGPLMLKRRGLVAGINSAMVEGGQNMNIVEAAPWDLPLADVSVPERSAEFPFLPNWRWLHDEEKAKKLLTRVRME